MDNNAGTVSTSDARVDWVCRKSYQFKSILSFSLATGAENTMTEDTGAPVTFSKVFLHAVTLTIIILVIWYDVS